MSERQGRALSTLLSIPKAPRDLSLKAQLRKRAGKTLPAPTLASPSTGPSEPLTPATWNIFSSLPTHLGTFRPVCLSSRPSLWRHARPIQVTESSGQAPIGS